MRLSNYVKLISFSISLMMIIAVTTDGGVPNVMNYQGRLLGTDSNPVPDSTYQITFRLWPDSTGGLFAGWQETQAVTTSNGYFSVLLGSVNYIDYWDLWNFPNWPNVYLGIQIDSETEMAPRSRIATNFFSFNSVYSDFTGAIAGATGGPIVGDVSASGMLRAATNSGSSGHPMIGDRWRDNSILAWAHINADASVVADYGVSGVSHFSTGQYTLSLYVDPDSLEGYIIPIAQIITGPLDDSLYVTETRWLGGNTIVVNTFNLFSTTYADHEFYLIVTGR